MQAIKWWKITDYENMTCTEISLGFASLALFWALLGILGSNLCRWLGTLELLVVGLARLERLSADGLGICVSFGKARWIDSISISRASNWRPKCETVTPSKPAIIDTTPVLFTETVCSLKSSTRQLQQQSQVRLHFKCIGSLGGFRPNVRQTHVCHYLNGVC